jgi:hypothetical protein
MTRSPGRPSRNSRPPLVEVPEVPDGEGVAVPGAGGAFGVPPVGETRVGGHVRPDRADLAGAERATGLVTHLDAGARSGRPDAARCRTPVVRRTGRELPLGGAVELPRGAVGGDLEDLLLQRDGTGRAGVCEQAQGREVVGSQLGQGEQPVEVGRDAEHRGGTHAAERVAPGGGGEAGEHGDATTEEGGHQREAERPRVVEGGHDQVCVPVPAIERRVLVLDEPLPPRRVVDPDVDALPPPGGPRRVGHRARPRPGRHPGPSGGARRGRRG